MSWADAQQEEGKMDIDVVKKDDGYWLVLNSKNKALIHLGTHGEIVTAVLDEAAQQSVEADVANEIEHTGIPETCKHSDCVRLFQSPRD